jgi:spore germination protein PB
VANFYIQQTINIHLIKIGSISNSSVLQIGSAGMIKPASHLFNTGGFTKAAPEATKPGGGTSGETGKVQTSTNQTKAPAFRSKAN